MKRRCIKPERVTQDMEDIAGIRVMCQFVEDIYYVVKLLRKRKDMQVIEERDYIKAQKQVAIALIISLSYIQFSF